MGHLRRLRIAALSAVSWRLPGAPARFASFFREAERGSAVDMLAAAELTTRRDLRRKYFIHALDETRHAALFHACALAHGAVNDRARAAVTDAGTLQHHGIVAGRSLFERLGELEFLAFVTIAEADAVEQFGVYHERRIPPPDIRDTLGSILKDEQFHVSYSRNALERFRKEGRGAEVDAALRRVTWRRVKESWLRFSRDIGAAVSTVWLTLLYLVVVAPFRALSRPEPGGWQPVRPDPRAPSRAARSQA